jgi:phospholipid/cholesterol/gamma-HCH transport system substrate-binding protein
MEMKKFYVEMTAGLFVLLGILCFAYLSIQLGGVNFFGAERYPVSATFSQVGALRSGAPVVIAGVDVGEVTDVSLKDFAAVVRMRINEDIELPTDSIASIRTRGLIGEQYVAVSPGGARETVEPGGRITETEPAIDLHSLIAKYAFGEVE